MACNPHTSRTKWASASDAVEASEQRHVPSSLMLLKQRLQKVFFSFHSISPSSLAVFHHAGKPISLFSVYVFSNVFQTLIVLYYQRILSLTCLPCSGEVVKMPLTPRIRCFVYSVLKIISRVTDSTDHSVSCCYCSFMHNPKIQQTTQ